MKSIRIRRSFILAAAAITLAATASAQSEWNSGTFTYNGLGNIIGIGQDVYVYDSTGRLVSGSAGGTTANRQEYSYDEFGNRLAVTTYGTGCIGGCATTAAVSTGTNRLTDHSATYDLAGNMKTFGSSSYTYDGAGMVSRVTEGGMIDWQFVYTADDERLASYTGQGNWRFTVRDVDAKVLREVTAYQGGSGTTWTLDRDHVYRNGLLLASVYPSGQRQQFHLDHLGTPRLVTDGNGAQIGTHTLYPFGDELSSGTDESPLSRFKFTGHERDTLLNREPLDDMHMRFFSPQAGRFFSPDRHLGNLLRPQSWNRYAYVLSNPVNFVDPSGLDEREPGEEMKDGDTCNGTVVDGWCTGETITVEAEDPGFDWYPFLEGVGNFSAGFGDTLTFGITKRIRQMQGTDQVVNPCSGLYLGGQISGVATSFAIGGGVTNAAFGVDTAAAEFGNITVRTAQYESELAGLGEAEKLAALGGRGSAGLQALKNIVNPAMWPTYARTTAMTGPTLGGGMGLMTGSVTAANAVHATATGPCF